jgi:hypothetical protein
MNKRQCPINGCRVQIDSKLLMCPAHWGMVPKPLRSEVWRWYRNGQENHPERVSTMYLDAANRAIKAVEETQARDEQAARQGVLL